MAVENQWNKEFIDKLRKEAENSIPIPRPYIGMGGGTYNHLKGMSVDSSLHKMYMENLYAAAKKPYLVDPAAGRKDWGFLKYLMNTWYGIDSITLPPVRKTKWREEQFFKTIFDHIMFQRRGCMKSYTMKWLIYERFYRKFMEVLKQINEIEPKMSLKAVVEWNKEYVNLYYINMKEVYKEWQDNSFCGATFAFELHIPTRSEAKAARVRTLRQMGLWFLDDITYNKNCYKGGDIMGLIHACMFGDVTTYPSTKIGLNLDTTIHEKSQKWLENKNKKGK